MFLGFQMFSPNCYTNIIFPLTEDEMHARYKRSSCPAPHLNSFKNQSIQPKVNMKRGAAPLDTDRRTERSAQGSQQTDWHTSATCGFQQRTQRGAVRWRSSADRPTRLTVAGALKTGKRTGQVICACHALGCIDPAWGHIRARAFEIGRLYTAGSPLGTHF